MRAIILAAGRGKRMGRLTDDRPKCLTKFKGRPLIEYQIEALQEAGIQEIGIVTGYKADSLLEYGTHHFHNPKWFETNMVCSLLCAKEWLQHDSCIVSYSDIFYKSQIIKDLMEAEGDLVVAYDPHWLELWSKRFLNPLDDAETFRIDNRSILLEIGKKTKDVNEIQGQYMGLLKISRTFLSFKDVLNENKNISMTEYLNFLISKGCEIKAIKNHQSWGEFDTSHDVMIGES